MKEAIAPPKEGKRVLTDEQYDKYLDKAQAEAQKGTCVPYLEALDISKSDKAKLFDAAANAKRRTLGRQLKENPFR